MNGYTKLFSSIVTSTVWLEPDHVRLVWITMLVTTNRKGIVEASLPGLASLARVSTQHCQEALKRLSEPDPYSRTKDDEGRRIREVDGGWQILNHVKYRDKLSQEERREYNTRKQRERRERLSTHVNICQQMSENVSAVNTYQIPDTNSREQKGVDLASSEDLAKVNTEVLTSAIPRARDEPWGSVGQNPHAKPTNLINGADLRRHGQHRWCDHERGMCVPYSLHENFQKRGQKSDADLLAWYPSVIAKMNGQPLGDDLFDFWRNEFGAWVGIASKKTSAFETKSDRRKRVFNEFREKHRGK